MHTDVLYSRPSWLTGVARLFDFWGLFDTYDTSKSDRVADARALAADWRAVGADLEYAMGEFAEQLPDSVDRSERTDEMLSKSVTEE